MHYPDFVYRFFGGGSQTIAAQIDSLLSSGTTMLSIAGGTAAAGPWADPLSQGAVGDGFHDDRQGLLNAAALGGNRLVMLSPGKTYRVETDTTINAGILGMGGIIVPDAGVTVTVNGDVQGGNIQMFDVSASGSKVVLPKVAAIWLKWLGGKLDGSTDDTNALLALSRAQSDAGRNPIAVLGPGLLTYSGDVTFGSSGVGTVVVGVVDQALRGGSATVPCVIKQTDSGKITLNGFNSKLIGVSLDKTEASTAANAVVFGSAAERNRLINVSLLPASVSSTSWSDAAVKYNNYNFGKAIDCEFLSAPALNFAAASGTRWRCTDSVFDCPYGADPVVKADTNGNLISFEHITFNRRGVGTIFWDNTSSSRTIDNLSFSFQEFDVGSGGAAITDPVIKAKNIRRLLLDTDNIEGYGGINDAFVVATNSKVVAKGATATSMLALVKFTDAVSTAYIEETNMTTNNTHGPYDGSGSSGYSAGYIPVTVGTPTAGAARIHLERGLASGNTVYDVNVANNSNFTVSLAGPADSSDAGSLIVGQRFTVCISNNSGGAMGTVTWNASHFTLNSAFSNPADTTHKCVEFVYNGTKAIELVRT